MNVIAWLAFANIVVSGVLIWSLFELRQMLIGLENCNIESYERFREITTDLLKLKEIKKEKK